jgi:hypothetical protein
MEAMMIISQRSADSPATRQSTMHPGTIPRAEDRVSRIEALLEEALDDSFPASDPLSSLRFD